MRVLFSQNKGRHGWHDWLFNIFFFFKSLKTLVGFRQKLKPLLQRVGQKKNENKAKLWKPYIIYHLNLHTQENPIEVMNYLPIYRLFHGEGLKSDYLLYISEVFCSLNSYNQIFIGLEYPAGSYNMLSIALRRKKKMDFHFWDQYFSMQRTSTMSTLLTM